jgi:hypothetical protein
MVLAPNYLFSWNNKYGKYTNIYIVNTFTFHLLALHINSLCASWHLEAVKGSSSSSSCRLLISPRITSYPFPCPGPTDAPCSRLWGPVPPFPKMAPPFTGSAHTPLPGSTTLTVLTTGHPDNHHRNFLNARVDETFEGWSAADFFMVTKCWMN